jgi:hypothetical protein
VSDAPLGKPDDTVETKREIFRQHVVACLESLPPASLAALRFNIEHVLPPNVTGGRWQFGIIQATAMDMLKGTREGRMTPEGVVLEDATASLDIGLLQRWLAEHRVNEEEVASFFGKQADEYLNGIASSSQLDERIVRIAQNVLEVRNEPVRAAGLTLMADAKSWTDELTPERRFPGSQFALKKAQALATRFELYKKQCVHLGLRDTKEFKDVQGATSALASALIGRFQVPDASTRLLPAQVEELRSVSVRLGLSPEIVNRKLT